MNFTSFLTSIIPECYNRRAVKRSDSVDIIICNCLLIEKFRILINILFLITCFRIIIKSSSVQFGPFVQINEIIFSIVTTALNCINFIRIFGHVLESWESFKRRAFVNEIDGQRWPLDI